MNRIAYLIATLVLLLATTTVFAQVEMYQFQMINDDYGHGASMQFANMDDDPEDELVIFNYTNSYVDIFDVDGVTLTLQERFPHTGNGRPTLGYVIDWDSDGDNDIVYSTSSIGIFIHRHLPDGWGPQDLLLGIGPVTFEIGDLTGDGHMDIVSPHDSGDYPPWWENNGDDTFTERAFPAVGSYHTSVELADFNNDGWLDVFFGNGPVLLINAGGVFTEVYSANYAAADVLEAVDFDGDGDLDVVYGENWFEELGIYEQIDGLQFVWHQIVEDEFSYAATDRSFGVADMDQDGDNDIVITSMAMVMFENAGDWQFDRNAIVPRTIWEWGWGRSMAIRDLDGNGWLDIMMAGTQEIAWVNHLVEENFREHLITDEELGLSRLATGDLTGNGHVDVVSVGEEVIVWEGDGLGNFAQYCQFTGDNYDNPQVGDMDGDGDLDFVVGQRNTALRWYENDGIGPPTPHIISTDFGYAQDIQIADEGNDGDLDVFVGDQFEYRLTLYRQEAGEFTVVTIDDTVEGTNVLHVADLDQDGYNDVLLADTWIDELIWYNYQPSTGTYERIVLKENVDLGSAAYIYDFDQDGDNDVIGSWDDVSRWLENNGAQQFSQHILHDDLNHMSEIDVADIDLDGDEDLAIADYYGNDVWWLERTGNTTFEPHILQTSLEGPDMSVSDIDEDGIPDIVAGGDMYMDEDPDKLAWFENLRGGTTPQFIDISLLVDEPVNVSPGGHFEFGAVFESNLPDGYRVDIWSEVLLPNGTPYGPLLEVERVPFGPHTVITVDPIYQGVPDYAPVGTYSYIMKAGRYPDTVVGEDSFEFDVVASTVGIAEFTDWTVWGFEDALGVNTAAETAPETLPGEFALAEVWPNPFNAVTTIRVDLPHTAELQLGVYNVMGQQVAILANGQTAAGQRTYTFDASGFASGLYFVRAVIPGELDAMRKVMLVK